ncbi:hypothetical protein FSARC_4795 [Fusarium sarcochroum]|uniref:3-hydroxyisobutyrate dehydrogenase n=1 Tax=Fusarium sarcochroum TaxID=1208366 RepID=A0A8H4U1F0_9HYPO|nr:hypothetical protein FSARC_4795 [Fusarium sarcochroum]
MHEPTGQKQTEPRKYMMELNVGFIGLGAIGYPMAASIRGGLSSKSVLHVFDVHKPACQRFYDEFISLGPIEIQNSPRQIASKADVVISMVPGPREVSHVYLDYKDGIISANRNEGRLLVECSTIDVATAKDVARQIKEAGRGIYVDAPVSRLREIITVMGDPNKLFWCGDVGSGLAGKISNNYISCSVLLLISEAMAIGVKSGVDPKTLQKIIHNSTGQTFMGDNVCPVPNVVPHAPSSNNWRLGFKTQMFLKDLSLGIEAARQQNLQPTMAEAAYGVFEKASKDPRCVDRDGSSVYLHITDTQEKSEKSEDNN